MYRRSTRRKNDWRKAKRKEWIVHHVYRWPEGWYDNLHEYSKGKIHCSCPLCAAKTNPKRKRIGRGFAGRDKRRAEAMDCEEKEYRHER